MKNFILVFVFILSLQTAFSYNVQWYKHVTGNRDDIVYDMKVDSEQNIYLLSKIESFDPYIANDSTSLTSYYYYKILKFDKTGKLLWFTSVPFNPNEGKIVMGIDKNDELVVAGSFFGGTNTFKNPDTTINFNTYDAKLYYIKYNSIGKLKWFKYIASSTDVFPTNLSFDKKNNIILSIYYMFDSLKINEKVTLPKTELTAQNASLLKISPEGECFDHFTLETPEYSELSFDCLQIDECNNVYILGKFSADTLYFSKEIKVIFDEILDYHVWEQFIVKYDSLGKCIWAKAIRGTSPEEITNLQLDSKGNLLISGFFKGGTVSFNNDFEFTNDNELNYDSYLAKFDPSGKVINAICLNGIDDEYLNNFYVDKNNNEVIIVGSFSDSELILNPNIIIKKNSDYTHSAFLAILDSNFQAISGECFSGDRNQDFKSIIKDKSGALLIAGEFSSKVLKLSDSYLLYNFEGEVKGSYDAFLFKYSNTSIVDHEVQAPDLNQIYPNPANQYITINAPDQIFNTYKIVNNLGYEVLYSNLYSQLNKEIKIDVHSLIPGIYNLILEGTNSRYSKSFIIQR